jgi:hypothetical protein
VAALRRNAHPNEQAKLETVVADLGRSLGLAFNLHVEAAPSDPDILIAHFIPVGCLVHNGRQWCRNINSEDAIRNANPALFSLLAHQIRERAAIDFPITAAADQAADNALKTEFTAIVRPKVVASLGFANKLRGAGYLLGLDIAKKMIEHYLSATGDPLIVTREEALSFDLIREAVDTNVERIREENFLQPPTTNPSYQVIVAALNASPGTKSTFTDEWKYDFNVTSTPGIRRYLEGYLEDGSATMSFLFGPGSSHLTSTGAFNLTRQADHIEVSGTVTHTWKDEGYNFDPGKFFAEEAAALEAAGLAKPFSWAAVWKDRIEGTLAFRSVQPTITSGLLRWESFEVHPAPMPPQ